MGHVAPAELTEAELEGRARDADVERQLMRLTPVHFALTASGGDWVPYPHVVLLAERFLDVAIGRIRRMLVTMPPQHGKTLTTIFFLAWLLCTYPHLRIAVVSYALEIAEAIGAQVLALIERWGLELWGIRVSPRKRSPKEFRLQGHRGGLVCSGVEGALTSRPVDVLVIDDPLKGMEEALSPTTREKTKRWFGTTALARLQKGGRVVITQTRWHEDDLSGWQQTLEAEGGTQWEKVLLPALAYYEDDLEPMPPAVREAVYPCPLGREPGEALCPDLHPEDELEEVRRVAGEEEFWCVYQGWPVPGKGGAYDSTWWRHWSLGDLPAAPGEDGIWRYHSRRLMFDDVIQSWDCSFKNTDSSSYVVGEVWAKKGPDRYLLALVRNRMLIDDTVAAALELARLFPIARHVVIEAKANGPRVMERLKREIPGVVPWIPEGPKEVRGKNQTHLVRGGNVFLPPLEMFGWVRPFIAEFSAFPKGRFNDQVDSYVQAMEFWETSSFAAPKQRLRPVNPLARYLG